MEGGSLVQEALLASSESRENGGSLRNQLTVDIFLLAAQDGLLLGEAGRIAVFRELIALCDAVNGSFTKLMNEYPWFSGGDGPVFGIHVTEADELPYLRATCNYGPTIVDEWAMIYAVIHISREEILRNAAVRFSDADDGQVLLIESAMVLPDWVDEVGPIGCEHRCWVVGGEMMLIRPKLPAEPLPLKTAIRRLRQTEGLDQIASVQAAILERIAPFDVSTSSEPAARWQQFSHNTAVLLPRRIAIVIDRFPSLLHCAVASFERFGYNGPPPGKLDFDDLVWTTQRFGRTSFALLRNLQTPEWTGEDHVPNIYKSAEVNRMKRTCRVESTPHLIHALELGVRLTAGLDYAMAQVSTAQSANDVSAEERVLKHWKELDVMCGGDGAWLRQAWMAGPNQSTVDLSEFISSFIASVDAQGFPFCKTQPRKVLKAILNQSLGNQRSEATVFTIPGPDEVDDEKWMHLSGKDEELADFLPSRVAAETSLDEAQHENAETPLNDMLGDFARFVEKPSDIEGVNTANSASNDDLGMPVTIDPKLFLNLLQKVLSSTPEEISNMTTEDYDVDPYFSRDDYELTETNEEDNEVRTMMDAMDLELKTKANQDEEDKIENPEVAQDAQVLSGLMESLDASEGAPGPVRNILQEMKASEKGVST